METHKDAQNYHGSSERKRSKNVTEECPKRPEVLTKTPIKGPAFKSQISKKSPISPSLFDKNSSQETNVKAGVLKKTSNTATFLAKEPIQEENTTKTQSAKEISNAVLNQYQIPKNETICESHKERMKRIIDKSKKSAISASLSDKNSNQETNVKSRVLKKSSNTATFSSEEPIQVENTTKSQSAKDISNAVLNQYQIPKNDTICGNHEERKKRKIDKLFQSRFFHYFLKTKVIFQWAIMLFKIIRYIFITTILDDFLKPNYFKEQCSSSSFLLTYGNNIGPN